MSLMPQEQPRFEEMEEVVKQFVQNINPTQIAKNLGIRRVDVLSHIEEWRKSSVGIEAMRGRIEDLIAATDEHYSLLIKKAYEVVEEVDNPPAGVKETMTRSQMLSQKMNAIKAIADFEAKRIDILQKAGILDNQDLGMQLVEMEEEKAFLIGVLHKELCDKCHPRVMGILAGNVGKDTIIVISESDGLS